MSNEQHRPELCRSALRQLVMSSAFVALFFFVIAVAFGQSDRGSITGTVSDATNAVIPGVSIVATNAQTGRAMKRSVRKPVITRCPSCLPECTN